VVHESEVLAPETIRQGGLVRKEKDKQHTFRAMTVKEPGLGTSILGLDKLADEKRARANAGRDDLRKRRRLGDGDSEENAFKGDPSSTLEHLCEILIPQFHHYL
jgi:pre-mRNA-splicing factor ATP-dependent RNA helicase DHX38/PRP16